MNKSIKISIGILVLQLLSLQLTAQEMQGINFVTGKDWSQIVAQAKAENKYVFFDCYATWCGPCKLMDKTVYPLATVGDYFNGHFISVRVQMDSTAHDDPWIKKSHKDAIMLQQNYAINAYPTYLFFSSDGVPVHKVTGSLSAEAFIQAGKDAQDPTKQYYRIAKDFKPGTLDTSEERSLAVMFHYTDQELAGKLAFDYLIRTAARQEGTRPWGSFIVQFQDLAPVANIAAGYLSTHSIENNLSFIAALRTRPQIKKIAVTYITGLNAKRFGTEANLKFIALFSGDSSVKRLTDRYIHCDLEKMGESDFLSVANQSFMLKFVDVISDQDREFKFCMAYPAKVDSSMHNSGTARQLVNAIIYREEAIGAKIDQAKESGTTPDWTAIANDITQKYGALYVEDNLAAGKLAWYHYKKDPLYTKYLVLLEDKQFKLHPPEEGMMSALIFNNNAFDIFQYDDDKRDLETALTWIDKLVRVMKTPSATIIDTQANLLYKLGRKNEAISRETAASRLSPNDKGIAETLVKMKKGEVTWALNGIK